MNNVTVDIADMKVSNSRDDLLITYALGSCVGVAIFDPVAGVGGLIHCMLPLSRLNPAKAQKLPPMFVDTGIPALFEEAYRLGARKDRIVVKAAGCAQILDDSGRFNIGQRNHTILRKMLWRNNVLIAAEDVGGKTSRTLYLDVNTGGVTVRSEGRISPL